MALPKATLATIRAYVREHALLGPGPLIAAVSGGTDSTALLLVLAELADEHGVVLHAAHFDHRTRPRAAAQDAQFVADLAARCNATVRVGRADAKLASEDAARNARYAFLRRVAAEIGATAIATGHTRDDQAETVLLHAIRGSGLAGVAAMRPEREGIVRPLLCVGRADTLAICAAAGIVPREDPSNRSLRFARNRIRRKVMPELIALNPRAPEALARLADSAAEALTSLRRAAERAIAAATREGGPLNDAGGPLPAAPRVRHVSLDLDDLGPDATVAEEALAIAWERATGRALSARTRQALAAEAARRDGSAQLDLPGGRAMREYATLHIAGRLDGQPRIVSASDKMFALEPEQPLRWGGWTLKLTAATDLDAWTHVVAAPEGSATLHVRMRRPGDRMAGNAHKLQDVLTDAKVPASQRDAQPVVVTRSGEVWWVPGVTSRPATGEMRIVAKRTG